MLLWRNHCSRKNSKQPRLTMLGINALAIALLLTLLFDGFATRSAALAQTGTVDSGSNGSDGALNLTTPGTIIFDPRSFNPPLDQDGDNIYHFTTINIAAGVTVTLSAKSISGPIYWLASDAVQISGVIDLNGQNGQFGPTLINNGSRSPAISGAGGYSGGVSGSFLSPAQAGRGPGGGRADQRNNSTDGNHGSGAGHVVVGAHGLPGGGAKYGNDFLVPLIGGSGGGGGADDCGGILFGGGGGAGGGAILIASSTSIQINGTIRANRGFQGGALPSGFTPCSGGRGSGGSIRMVAPTISGTGRIEALGAFSAQNEISGSDGRIRLEAFQHTFTGVSNPAAIRRTPISLFLPLNPPPSVQVISVTSASVPQTPTNNFATPDVTINASGSATVTIEARYVPVGSVVTLVLISEERTDQVVTSTPLAGTLERSTATVIVTIPTGHSRMYVYTKWTP